ncbi:MAG: hypothetical protein IKA22_06520, partial [Lentisphaeria bacterium]|nr:hypothetical protein [Lentisphaeria bacterium]
DKKFAEEKMKQINEAYNFLTTQHELNQQNGYKENSQKAYVPEKIHFLIKVVDIPQGSSLPL